jgi:hypothetical protein
MNDAASSTTGRFGDPTLCSVIFAPRPQNYTLSSVTAEGRITEGLGLEALRDPGVFVTRRMFENMRRLGPELRELFARYLRDYLETSFTTATLNLPIEVAFPGAGRVPARSFPFVDHLDLLALPTEEGMSFDPDDFVER